MISFTNMSSATKMEKVMSKNKKNSFDFQMTKIENIAPTWK